MNRRWLLAATPVILLVTHYVAVLPHEFSHSIMAWLTGIKPTPGDIDWGGTGLWNIFLLAHVDENVDYSAALAAGHHWQVAMAAAAGPVIGNALPYLLVRRWLFRWRLQPAGLYVVFWYLFFSLVNVYDYVPLRTFAPDGDVTHFVEGSGVSRWWIYAVVTPLVVWGTADLYRRVLPTVLERVGFARAERAVLLVVATASFFGYFAIPALEESDPVTLFLGRTSLLLIPIVVVATWRRVVGTPTGDDPVTTVPTPAEPARR
ncbi:MAG: hypothetical protein J0I34_05915 [Pseudonocardia sp.]|uniref:hypothetical protein n=1 Tax=unclassified Pseudonocardia TaxID=2619320 RepID=UPI00086A8B6D|nr:MULTISPECIES: hypothetical protein [unclassified Pseudonocardia]MBN9108299.1 hypothetical protein [Pseudonocardia sp.]ODU29024.1 MAG: hypothetical protein ABS80_02080 [Pseudonocardia sp. SCN 72-51]ODV08686.1 MAG: hypothetical protein ABT15_02390 [Pseudonocardia sp. SCN 73-27]